MNIEPAGQTSQAVRLRGFAFHPDLNRLTQGQRVIQLTPKASAVLSLLVSRPAAVFSRAQIIATVWAGRCPTDDVLTHAITELRRSLADNPKNNRFIETIPRVGYRLVCSPQALVSVRKFLGLEWRRALAAGFVAVALLAVVWTAVPGGPGEPDLPLAELEALTVVAGDPQPRTNHCQRAPGGQSNHNNRQYNGKPQKPQQTPRFR